MLPFERIPRLQSDTAELHIAVGDNQAGLFERHRFLGVVAVALAVETTDRGGKQGAPFTFDSTCRLKLDSNFPATLDVLG